MREILRIAARQDLDPAAVAARLGRPLDNTRSATIRDGIAIVPVSGPIFRYANVFSDISGATSIEMLARDFAQAVGDPAVRGILLAIDSPGGQVNGVNELAEMIWRARTTKPIEAYVSGTAASAGYWLASAAERITVDATARLGSIGIMAALLDTRERDRKAGVETIQIISSNAPDKSADPQTERGRAAILAELDQLETIFVDRVARNRGVARDHVLADFGRGGIRVGGDAVTAGMADDLGSFEDRLADLIGRTRPGAAAGGVRRTAGGTPARRGASPKEMAMTQHDADPPALPAPPAGLQPAICSMPAASAGLGREDITADLVARDFPAVADQLVSQARAAAVAGERARIAGIDEMTLPGHEALAARAKAEGLTVDAFLVEQTRAERTRHGQRLADLQADAEALPVISASPQPAGSIDSARLARQARELVDAEARDGRVLSYAEAVRRVRSAA